MKYADKSSAKMDCSLPVAAGEGARRDALKRIRAEAENAVRGGAGHIVLTDEAIGPDQAAMPMILATGAVHSHLVRQGLRTFTSLTGRSGECLDVHYFAEIGRASGRERVGQDV